VADFPRYEGAASRCSGKAQPGVVEFMEWVTRDFGRGARNLGIYNCRSVRGSANRSIHGDGRAGDAGFPGKSNPSGTALLNVLLPNVRALGIQMVIWDRRIWSAKAPNGARYQGTVPHTDHLHIEFQWGAARSLTRDRVRQIIGGATNPQPVSRPAPQVQGPPTFQPTIDTEDDDMAYLRDDQSGAIFAVYGQRYRHLSGPHWAAQEALARFAGKPLAVENKHPMAIAKLITDLGLIKDPT